MTAVKLLNELVSIPSLSGEERPAAEFLVSEMKKLGFNAEVDSAGNAVGIIGQGKTKVLLLGHIDTVEGKIPVMEKQGNLYGRGSVDAKGALCAFVSAASKFKDSEKLQIFVVGAVEEESATSKGARHILKTIPKPDFVVIGEPSGVGGISIGYKGRVLIEYSVKLKQFHSSRGERNAIMQAVDFWNSIENYFSELNKGNKGKKMFDSTISSIRTIYYSVESMQDAVNLTVGLRTPLDFDLEKLKKFINTIKGPAEISYHGIEKAVLSEKNNSLVKSFLSAIRSQNIDPSFKLKSGTCDMNVVAPVWNVPAVAYGPGDSNLDHTPNEHIYLQEYEKSIGILQQMLQNLEQSIK